MILKNALQLCKSIEDYLNNLYQLVQDKGISDQEVNKSTNN